MADNEFEKEEALIRCAEIFRSIDRPYVRRLDGCRPVAALASDIQIAIQEGPIRAAEWSDNPSGVSQEALASIIAKVNAIRDDASVPMEEKVDAVLRIVAREVP